MVEHKKLAKTQDISWTINLFFLILNIVEVDSVTHVHMLDEAVFISHSTKSFEKGMNPTIFPPAMGK